MTDIVDEPVVRRRTVGVAWIAEAIAVSDRTVCRMAEQGLIPGRLDLGRPRLIRFDRATVERWLAALAD